MKKIISLLGVAAILFVFTFYIDGEIGMILTAFIAFAAVISVLFAFFGRKRIAVSFDCDGYVKKGGTLTVNVTVEKQGGFPLGIVSIKTASDAVFGCAEKTFRLSLSGKKRKDFSYTIDAITGGNGEISVVSVHSSGFMGFIGFKIMGELPAPKSVGVIPEIPKIRSSSMLFRNIADSVITSDDESSSDSAMLFSANTAPGYDHREYVQGDPLKRVNWKLSVKKDKLMVRLDEAATSVQPVVMLDLYRGRNADSNNAVIAEEKLICAVFGLITQLIEQGVASTFVYYGAGGELTAESIESPDHSSQLLLKVLAEKVIPERRIRLHSTSACACLIASTDISDEIAAIVAQLEDKDSALILGVSADSRNDSGLPMWYLDDDNNFRI